MPVLAVFLSVLQPRLRRVALLGAWLGGALLAPPALAQNARRNYELPAGDAATALRQLSVISGREVLFAADVVRGVRTNAVRGDFTPLEAVTQLLAGTSLSVVQDDKTGALAVRREKRAPSAPTRPAMEKRRASGWRASPRSGYGFCSS